MLVMELPASGLAQVRFGSSALTEVTASVWTVERPGQPSWIRRWWHDVRPQLPDECLRLVRELAPGPGPVCVPEFALPLPPRGAATLEEELETLLARPAEMVRTEIREALEGIPDKGLPGAPRPLTKRLVDSVGEDGYLALLAEQLHRYWKIAIEPYWPRLRSGLDRELEERGRELATLGSGAALARLHPEMAYRDDRIVLKGTMHDVRTAERGVTFTASVFMHSGLLCGRNADGIDQVYYPVRRAGAVWQPAPGRAAGGTLTDLLGPARAALLADLDTPHTTAELATRHKIAASTASYHLGVLHRAGLLTRTRDGRHILYRRTKTGDALIH